MNKPKIPRSTLIPLIILILLAMTYVGLIFAQPHSGSPEQGTSTDNHTPPIIEKTHMSTSLNDLLIQAFPQLSTPASKNLSFGDLRDWLNTTPYAYMGYVELKEYYDNGIEQNLALKQANVDTKKLEQELEQKISEKFDNVDEESDDPYDEESDDPYDAYEAIYEMFFETLKQYANQADLDLLVIHRENPYWMVVPRKAQVSQKIVDAFNAAYGKDEHVGEMVVY